jgi:hypothetical protein
MVMYAFLDIHICHNAQVFGNVLMSGDTKLGFIMTYEFVDDAEIANAQKS